ncbi:hypothetical protein [Desulfovibrio sp. JC010]|uniref:hypothetical protein n=1 Tax=Desulfovibrio sp. JC010 TaxID=2593641 RepID=UPI0013CFD42D|nr:hypothetical protein [Desulfovibrio sp. JC010]NDV28165.1 hypothetical protein [Desulfovibrio sp. JC010]
MKLVCGVGELGIPAMLAKAEHRIVFHAAVYGPFLKSKPHIQGLEKALSRPGFSRLDVIAVQSADENRWTDPFLNALRFGISRQSVADELDYSRSFLGELAGRYPDKVNVYPAGNLPCLPLVIVDDTICFGQYAHACFHAPEGFWGCVEADVEALFSWAESGRVPPGANADEVAAFRLVSECSRAMKCSAGSC